MLDALVRKGRLADQTSKQAGGSARGLLLARRSGKAAGRAEWNHHWASAFRWILRRCLQSFRRFLQTGEQLRQREAQRPRYQDQIRKAHVALTPFDSAHPRPVNAHDVGKALLRPPLLEAECPYPLPERQ